MCVWILSMCVGVLSKCVWGVMWWLYDVWCMICVMCDVWCVVMYVVHCMVWCQYPKTEKWSRKVCPQTHKLTHAHPHTPTHTPPHTCSSAEALGSSLKHTGACGRVCNGLSPPRTSKTITTLFWPPIEGWVWWWCVCVVWVCVMCVMCDVAFHTCSNVPFTRANDKHIHILIGL